MIKKTILPIIDTESILIKNYDPDQFNVEQKIIFLKYFLFSIIFLAFYNI